MFQTVSVRRQRSDFAVFESNCHLLSVHCPTYDET